MITKGLAPFPGAKVFAIMENRLLVGPIRDLPLGGGRRGDQRRRPAGRPPGAGLPTRVALVSRRLRQGRARCTSPVAGFSNEPSGSVAWRY